MIFTREVIMREVWGHDGSGDTRTLGVHVTGLRKKLQIPQLIETIRGIGFRLVP
jgi:DNA-binding response OmpR family regulator